MNSGDHSTSYAPSRDIDFPSADDGLVLSRKKGESGEAVDY
jgi:hypothetical protein